MGCTGKHMHSLLTLSRLWKVSLRDWTNLLNIYLSIISVPIYMLWIKCIQPFSSPIHIVNPCSVCWNETYIQTNRSTSYSSTLLTKLICHVRWSIHLHPKWFYYIQLKIFPMAFLSEIPLMLINSNTVSIHFFCSVYLFVHSTILSNNI